MSGVTASKWLLRLCADSSIDMRITSRDNLRTCGQPCVSGAPAAGSCPPL